MLLNLQNEKDVFIARTMLNDFIDKGMTIDLLAKMQTRTTRQNKALHLFFTIISNQLNEMGLEFQYYGLKGQTLGTRYTPDVVKNFFWRPIQETLFDIKSTTKINTQQINEITEVIQKFFSERGVVLEFPSIESLTS